MSQSVLTVRQVRQRINTFGKALILYVIILTIFRHGLSLFEKYLPQVFFNQTPEMVFYVGMNILILILSFFPFNYAGKKLDLDLSKYYKKGISTGNLFIYSCVSLGIYFIFTSFMTLFSIFFSTGFSEVNFLGNYRSVDYIIANIAYFIYVVIVKPFCDEYVFRGVIQRSLGIFGRYFGVISSALLYAFAQGNLIEAIPAFFIGWFLSLITIKYHSIKPTIMIQSLTSLFLYLIKVVPDSFLLLVQIAIFVIYVVVTLFIFSKHRSFASDITSVLNGKLWKILMTSYSIIIVYLIFFINVIISIA